MEIDFSVQKIKIIEVKNKSGIHFIALDEIIYIECKNYKSTLYLKNNQELNLVKCLKNFEEDLSEFGFLRINRSILVNLLHVKQYIGGKNGVLRLINDNEFKISRSRKIFFHKK